MRRQRFNGANATNKRDKRTKTQRVWKSLADIEVGAISTGGQHPNSNQPIAQSDAQARLPGLARETPPQRRKGRSAAVHGVVDPNRV